MIFDRLKRWLGGGSPGDNGTSHDEGHGGDSGDMITCHEALERIYEYMDGELEGVTAEQVEAHFRVCARCFPHLKLERTFRARVQEAMTRPGIPSDLRSRVLETLARETPGT